MTAQQLAAGIALGAAILVGATTGAEARPDVRQLTCAQANALVREAGSIVMTTGRHTYRRFVANRFYCDPGYLTRPFPTETADNASCPVNGVCWDPPINLPGFDFFRD